MKKISSLVLLFVFLVVATFVILGPKQKEYTKASYRQTIENSIRPLDQKAPEKQPATEKPSPKQPPKNQQPPPGRGGPDPSNPGPEPGKPPQVPCSCGHGPGTGSG